MDSILKVLGVVWSVIAFVFAAGFFFSGEWQIWQKIKSEHTSYIRDGDARYVKSGDRVAIKLDGTYYLYGNPNTGRPETGVLLNPASQTWSVQKQ